MQFTLRAGPRDMFSPAEVRGHHPVHVDPIAELQSDGHGEPPSAQPGVGYLPVREQRKP